MLEDTRDITFESKFRSFPEITNITHIIGNHIGGLGWGGLSEYEDALGVFESCVLLRTSTKII